MVLGEQSASSACNLAATCDSEVATSRIATIVSFSGCEV